MTTFFAGGIPTASDLNALSRKVLKWGQRTSTSTTSASTTRVPVLRVDAATIITNHLIEVGYRFHPDSGTATDQVVAEVRSKTGGANATTSDSILQGSQSFGQIGIPRYWSTFFVAGSSDQYSFILDYARNSGAGTCQLFCDANRVTELFVIDWGIVTDSGVDL